MTYSPSLTFRIAVENGSPSGCWPTAHGMPSEPCDQAQRNDEPGSHRAPPRIEPICYLPSTENASSTLPGMPFWTYPELTKSIPPLIAGPATFSDPPRAGTPLTVS